MKEQQMTKQLKDNKAKEFAWIMTHCSDVMKQRIKEKPDYELDAWNNPVDLLKRIKKEL